MSLLKKLGLVEDDSAPPVTTPAPAQAGGNSITIPATSQYAPATYAFQSPAQTSYQAAPANPDMVNKIKDSVFGASPIFTQFMQNLELVRPQFPNDEGACMKAALAFTRVDKNSLVAELNKTVAAALIHTRQSLDNEHKKARESAVGGLEQQLSSINSEIQATIAQITELQSQITAKQAATTDLQAKIRDAEANLQQQDAVVKGSLTQVEQYVANFGQTLSRL